MYCLNDKKARFGSDKAFESYRNFLQKGDQLADRSIADNLLNYEEFIKRCTTRGYDTFELGTLYEVDVSDFTKVNYSMLLEDIRLGYIKMYISGTSKEF